MKVQMNTTTELLSGVQPRIQKTDSTYNIPLGHLRAFVTALVVAHHAVLAYHPWAPPGPASLTVQPRWWQAFPVVDAHRWTGWALFVSFNDVFFMALMFFISGLFVWNSLERKGSGEFVRGRLLRLGLPFILAAGLLGPIAYYPAYLQIGGWPHSLAGFWAQWQTLGTWPAGPAWFIWVLLAFGCAAAALHRFAPHWAESAHRALGGIVRRPFAFFCALVFLTGLAYVPMAQRFGALDWREWGPFSFQTSRIFLYAIYFAAGIILGAGPLENTFLVPGGSLSKRWIAWLVAAVIAFLTVMAIAIAALTHPAAMRPLTFVASCLFAVSCAASSFALLALFLRFARKSSPLAASFCAAAYGIYLIHYPIVSWLQFALLSMPISGFLKGVLVTAAALALSWGLIALARHLRTIRRIV